MKSGRIYLRKKKFFAGFTLCCAVLSAGCGTDSALTDDTGSDCDSLIEHETFFDPEDTKIEVIYD